MHNESIREYCLSLPDTEESTPFGPDVLVYKVKGKIFLLLPLDTGDCRFNVKCDPEKALELRDQYPCVLPGYHMNKKHWNTVLADGTVSDRLLKEWIRDSYELVKGGGKKR